MKHQIDIVSGVCAKATNTFDKISGIPNKTMVLTRPIAEETQPPTNEPAISPRTYKVAEEIRKYYNCVLSQIYILTYP